MLQSLHIRNLALVTSLELDFSRGLNVITGETGAGKSLIIGAIQLLFGGRATATLIRKGEESCDVSAVILLTDAAQDVRRAIDTLLQQTDIPANDDDTLLLRRVVTENGSRAYVNATPVTAAILKTLGELLVDIHGPHDNQTLLKPSCQLALLDTYANADALLDECRAHANALSEISAELAALSAEGLNPEDAELLKHQWREIHDAALQPGEDAELSRQYTLAEHSKHLLETAQQTAQILSDGDGSILDTLGTALRLLREIEQIDSEHGTPLCEQLLDIHEHVQSLGEAMDDYAQATELDPDAFQAIEDRLELVQKLKRKYGPSLDDVFDTQKRIRERLERIRGRGDRIKELRASSDREHAALTQACAALDATRREAAGRLEKAIEEKLRALGFAKARFHIYIRAAAEGPHGANAIEFQFAPNIGENLQSLRETASSGETARVMLAVKTVLSEIDSVPILIFDEIDANVGGRVATVVADELRAVGIHHQVFSISHLPQIAAAADAHFLVEKHVENDRTLTTMTRLTTEGRTAEIIRMLGADATSKTAASHARELLRNATSRTRSKSSR